MQDTLVSGKIKDIKTEINDKNNFNICLEAIGTLHSSEFQDAEVHHGRVFLIFVSSGTPQIICNDNRSQHEITAKPFYWGL